jgi:hypothetical protein
VKVSLAALALLALVLGTAGVTTLLVERRLVALAPGRVEIAALRYNPLSGGLVLDGVQVRDAAGRPMFHAERISARLSPLRLVQRPLTLSQARVRAPGLTLRAASGLDVVDLAAAIGAATIDGARAPVRIEDLSIAGGRLLVEGVGADGAPVRAGNLDVRLSRLTTATAESPDVAFAVEMAAYGAVVHVTGQPRGAGYAIRVRARGLDVAHLARDFPVQALEGLGQGLGDVDAELLLTGGRVLASGHVRVADVTLRLPLPGRPRLRAETLAAVVDAFDLTAGTGRITRLDVGAPSLSLPVSTAGAVLEALVAPLQERPELVVRRVTVTDGTLALSDAPGVTLRGIELSAHSSEFGSNGPWTVSAQASLGSRGAVAIDGVLARDFRGLDATTRLQRVALAPWRALTGLPAGWNGDLSFDGRLQLQTRRGEPMASLTGAAVLANVDVTGTTRFRADRIEFAIRRLQWPEAAPVVDNVVMTRPAFALPAAVPWPPLFVTGDVSVVDGELHEAAGGHALRDLAVDLAPVDPSGAAHLRLSASTDAGHRLGLDRIVTYEAAGVRGVPLPVLQAVLEDVSRTTFEAGTPGQAATALSAPPTPAGMDPPAIVSTAGAPSP